MRPSLRTTGLALFSTALLATGLGAAAAATTEVRAAGAFTAVALSAPIDVDIALGEHEGVVLEGEESVLARIETRVKDGTLRIRMAPSLHLSWRGNKVRAHVTARRIEALSIAGSGDIRAPEVRGDALKISVSGSGDVVVGGGQVGDLALSISGSGDIRTGKLEAQRVKVSISGSGDATVWARQWLAVRVAGSGDVRFYGDPQLDRHVAGSGEVRRLGASPS
jgi:hypothetical protein